MIKWAYIFTLRVRPQGHMGHKLWLGFKHQASVTYRQSQPPFGLPESGALSPRNTISCVECNSWFRTYRFSDFPSLGQPNSLSSILFYCNWTLARSSFKSQAGPPQLPSFISLLPWWSCWSGWTGSDCAKRLILIQILRPLLPCQRVHFFS